MNLTRPNAVFLLVLSLTLLVAIPATAQNKVVVVPLMEDAPPPGPPAAVPKTGQTTCTDEDGNTIACANTGQDGDIQAGVASPNPRFADNGNGTVTDELTGLIWLQSGNCNAFYSGDATGQNDRKWQFALDACNALASGYCGLTDSSAAGDWHLPNAKELYSLIDLGQFNPALPPNHLLSVFSWNYWSATTLALPTGYAWSVYFGNGYVEYYDKSNDGYVRCVR